VTAATTTATKRATHAQSNWQKHKGDNNEKRKEPTAMGGPKGWPGDRVHRWTGVNVSRKLKQGCCYSASSKRGTN